MIARAGRAHHSQVPELRDDLAAARVNEIDQAPPSGKRRVTVQLADRAGPIDVHAARGRMIDRDAAGHDEADFTIYAPAIELCHVLARNAAR